MAGTAEKGRSPRPGAVPQQRDAAAATQRSGGGAGAHPQKVPEMAGRPPGVPRIVFHGLRYSSATYQLLQSGGDFKSVQGNTGHATATVLMDTYAHTQDKPRLELTEKIEADFYSQDVAGAKPQEPPENKTPVATKITGKMILEAIRQMDAEERRELTQVLFA